MLKADWPEVEQAEKEGRHELVLVGPDISKRIEEDGIDPALFQVSNLNFLEISKTNLTAVGEELGKLVNLTQLMLHHNKLTSLPDSLGKLSKLKFLDLSQNELECLPSSLSELSEVQSLNVNCNKLTEFPDVSTMVQLHILDVSHNQLTELPGGITDPELNLLAQVIAGGNAITEIPAALAVQPSLKTLDVSNNKLTEIPAEFGEAGKLKEFNFAGNKLKDRRLGKMMDQCGTKSVLDYLRNQLEKQREQEGKGKGKKGKGKGKKGKGAAADNDVEDLSTNFMQILHFQDDGLTIKSFPEASQVRPYIVCTVVRKLNFNKSNNMFKRFITLQTKLHDTICMKRQAATIATHDLEAIKTPLVYTAVKPQEMMLVPLFKQKEVSAAKLVDKLRNEAEEVRKEKKRNTFSGIHKYLDLLKGKPVYPCLVDSEDTVISFPPITNCEKTKISKDTTSLLIEVTSSQSLDVCKKVLDALLKDMLEMGVGEREEDGAAAIPDTEMPLHSHQQLVVEQVRILDQESVMKVVYPSRADLIGEGYRVVRNYD